MTYIIVGAVCLVIGLVLGAKAMDHEGKARRGK